LNDSPSGDDARRDDRSRGAGAFYTARVPAAVIAFDFDPFLHLGDGVVRWETVAIAVAIFISIVLAAIGARTMDLSADDLLFVVLGIVPGAVIGGRIGYVLLHPAFFSENPGAILDPGVGSLELSLAVVGGAITGGIVAALLEGDVGRWFHVSALPVLFVIGTGKLAMVLGGDGQGQPWDGGWATAYLGDGPWSSLAPALPSHPSQAYEGIATLVVLVVLMGVLAVPGLRRPDGRAFLVAIGLWALVRAVIASTWRDPATVGPLNTEQVICLVLAVGCVVGVGLLIRREPPSSAVTVTG
jgi:phosphatidylglycerol:prolipoprotein diacylglycerol transferase